ncbi:MAG: hypothetical protein LBJ20_06290 [Candidatus Methanoplasma sp.]|jgi:hypothetical protein|nr:hypothetical protein [Candidatus Methanoplasma sp.]
MILPQKLKLLSDSGKGELTGMFLRNRNLTDLIRDIRLKARSRCETTHASMKKWISFAVKGTRHKGRENKILCKFFCIQALAFILMV